MAYVDFISKLHKSSKRDYVARVTESDKAESAEIAIQYGKDYWDGDRKYGYGGYQYDGRWRTVAESMINHYNLKSDSKILDVGCGKGYLLYEFKQILPNCEIQGIDISEYASQNSKPEITSQLKVGTATTLPFENNYFDYVVSITTLHNLYNYDLSKSIKEIERVGKNNKHITVESYRNEREKMNLLYWQLTCRSFYTPQEWEWFMGTNGYTGDYSCIFFE